MHRYEELEKLYYKKLYLKFFFIFIIIVFLAVGYFLFFNKKNLVKSSEIRQKQDIIKNKKNEINSSKKINKEKNQIIKTQKEIKKEKNQEIRFILPDLDFIKEPKEKKKIKKSSIEKNTKTIKTKTKQEHIITSPQVNDIKIEENNANLQELIKEYKQNKDYNLAITIANIYLKRNDLKNAQIWALNANSLNPSRVDSWVIFADILLKENKKEKAKELLKAYIDSYGNNDIIEEKLRSINNGR